MPSNHDIDSADIWLSALRAAGHSPKTLETYGHAVRQLRDWWQSNQDLSTLTKLEARAFVRHLQETYTPGGTRVRVRSLRALFGWLIGEALVTDNPFANLRLTVADTPQRTATDAEIEAMLDHARKASNELAGTSLAVGSLGVSIWSIQVARGRDFFNRLKTHAGVDTDELLVELVSHDEQRQMVFTAGLERSLEADWERTRDVLAKVVAETLRGDEWRLDEVTLLLRTASQLGRNDVTVLTELAKPERDRYEDSTFVGAASDRDISSALPADTAVLLPPVLGALSAQGLIVDGALGTWSYGGPRWLLTPYAFRFLRYLFPAAEVHQAVLAVSLGTARLYVRNLGRSDATVSAVEATSDGRVLNRSTVVPFPIRAGEQVDVACDTDLGPGAGARLRVAWRDGTEVESIVERYQNGS